jgi:putative oxidoreductase
MGSCLGPLVLRLSIAAFMIPHGYGKITNWSATVKAFEGMNIPAPMTVIAILTEFFGPILLILGLGTRFASLFLLILIAVAAFKGGHVDKGFTDPAGYAQHLLFGGACLALMLIGPGKVALDSLICCILKKKRCCAK